MKIPGGVLKWVCTCSLVGMAAILPAAAFAQDERSRALPALMAGGFLMFFMVFALATYVYVALALSTIAEKTNTENGWLAWIPIANVILMLNIARKPIWWIVLCLIPLVNIVIFIILWMGIAEARNKPSWWGVLMLVPVVTELT
jgi:Family of unknown function (DUF5684)